MSDCPHFDFANMCKYVHRCIKWCNIHHSSRESASHHSGRAWLFRQWGEINERTTQILNICLIDSFSCVNLEIAMQLHNDSRSQNHDNDTSCIRFFRPSDESSMIYIVLMDTDVKLIQENLICSISNDFLCAPMWFWSNKQINEFLYR